MIYFQENDRTCARDESLRPDPIPPRSSQHDKLQKILGQSNGWSGKSFQEFQEVKSSCTFRRIVKKTVQCACHQPSGKAL